LVSKQNKEKGKIKTKTKKTSKLSNTKHSKRDNCLEESDGAFLFQKNKKLTFHSLSSSAADPDSSCFVLLYPGSSDNYLSFFLT